MSTADQIVKGALLKIGAHSTVNPSDPEILEEGLASLVSLLREHVLERIFYGVEIEDLTSAATTATGTLTDHDLAVDDAVHVSGAYQDEYNGVFDVLAVPDADTFTYTLAEETDTPATRAEELLPIRVVRFPAELGANVYEDPAATEALKNIMAVRLAPVCRKVAADAVQTAAALGIGMLKDQFQKPEMPVIVPSRLMPRGQGASRGPQSDTFFRGQEIDADSSS
jgi:hypothetical protein